MKKRRIFRNLNDKEFAWVLYDVGNSAYTMLACALIPIWFKAMAIGTKPGQLTSDRATAYYSMAIAVITIVVALLGPVCGAISDYKGMKKIFFTSTVAVGVCGCILNGFACQWIVFLLLFAATKIFYNMSLMFYDSMLNDITTEERMDEVSSYGYAWGYLGSCIPFLIALVAYVLDRIWRVSFPVSYPWRSGLRLRGLWWLLVTVPLIKNYKQINYVEKKEHAVRSAFRRIFETIRFIATKDKKVFFFLIAFFLYIDGVGTIIDNCINIGTDLNLSTVGQVICLLATQVVAFGGSLVFAKLSKKYDTVQLILVCIAGYFIVCLYALTLKNLIGFSFLAFGVGCFQGSIQSLSRSYFSKIIPPDNSGEYFGLYDIFSKGASFLGSAVIAGVKLAGGTINIAVASQAIFFFLGFIFLKIADGKERRIVESK